MLWVNQLSWVLHWSFRHFWISDLKCSRAIWSVFSKTRTLRRYSKSSTLLSSGMPVHFICVCVCVYVCVCVCVWVSEWERERENFRQQPIRPAETPHHREKVNQNVGVLPDDHVCFYCRVLKSFEHLRVLHGDAHTHAHKQHLMNMKDMQLQDYCLRWEWTNPLSHDILEVRSEDKRCSFSVNTLHRRLNVILTL